MWSQCAALPPQTCLEFLHLPGPPVVSSLPRNGLWTCWNHIHASEPSLSATFSEKYSQTLFSPGKSTGLPLCSHAREVKVKSLSRFWLFVTPRTVDNQAPLSMGFSRQEYWSGFPFPYPGDLPNPGIEPVSPTLQADALYLSHWESLSLCLSLSLSLSLPHTRVASKPGCALESIEKL